MKFRHKNRFKIYTLLIHKPAKVLKQIENNMNLLQLQTILLLYSLIPLSLTLDKLFSYGEWVEKLMHLQRKLEILTRIQFS